MSDPHVAERESIIQIWDENLGRDVSMQNVVPRLSNEPGHINWPGHEAGQDNELVYQSIFGIGADEYASLKSAGVI
jgi:crotonobetainyl-CoA:carnitine CoA-transferase CaiB-like acyl-CoA transferase